MNVWTIKEGEPLPLNDSKGRIMRCGIISGMLAERGHNVTWWSSTFSHQLKERVRQSSCTEFISKNYKLILLHSQTIYIKNISLSRIRYHKNLAKQFISKSKTVEKPDVIYCSYPTIDFAYAAVKYGKEYCTPVVIDVRDFWPDIFIQPFPKVIHPVIKLFLFKHYRMARYSIKNATAVIGVVPSVFDWTVNMGRAKKDFDQTVFLAYDLKSSGLEKAACYWKDKGFNYSDNIICYFGNIVERVDFLSVVEAGKILKEKSVCCKFVICGTGAFLTELIKIAKDLENFIFPGFIDQDKIQALMEISIAGVLPYFNSRKDFVDAVPNKAIEYLAGGIPVLSSLQGFLSKMLCENECGLTHSTPYELAGNVEYLINNRKIHYLMKDNAKRLYRERFTASKVYGDFCDFLEQIANQKP